MSPFKFFRTLPAPEANPLLCGNPRCPGVDFFARPYAGSGLKPPSNGRSSVIQLASIGLPMVNHIPYGFQLVLDDNWVTS